MHRERSGAAMLDLSPPPPRSIGLQAEREVFERILGAIAERRLPPGTKLTEESLVEIFGVTRARVRKVLLLLSQRGLVALEPNRGAFVAQPGRAESVALFHARRVIESETASLLAGLPQPERVQALARLDAHLEEEAAARRAEQPGAVIRLSGEFHRLVAELAGNPVLAAIIEDLVWRTALALATHATRDDTDCSPAEHPAIVEAFRAGDGPLAVHLMTHHLDHIVSSLGE
ncbi:GntR family transcriptional regulator [Labrys monachus]|uniref:DNA-binding GntR family transcriptional regulator n=1 Tax=Labrys monachus TaxID=217067 RepID=A0ABU0F9T5_9HYPH|nr:GntR family transcriptional regulator [Labrys monachus]MDQ0391378.1 DNA-binding GntR family transcriptional regulator [Labrys monachus]